MDFVLFLLVNATLFLRPSEIFPDLATVRLYEAVIIACAAVSFPSVLAQFSIKNLESRPITVCLLIMWPLCALSHVVRSELGLAGEALLNYFKILVYYLLMVGIINTPRRLRGFLLALAVFITVLTFIAVLRYYEVVTIKPPPINQSSDPANDKRAKKDDGTDASVVDEYFDDRTGEIVKVRRLRGTGIFNDPNDLCLALVTGILICCYVMSDPKLGGVRFLCLAPMGLFVFALRLTSSRGGLLGLLAGLGVLFWCRFGWRRALMVGTAAIPVVLIVFGGGRMTDIADAASSGTGQARIQLWRDGMVLFKESPVFGVGIDQYRFHARQVAHNSFVHAYTEIGFVGGTAFMGAFFCAFWGLKKLRDAYVYDNDLRRLLPFVLAMVAGYIVGILSLSRNFEVPTYTMLGLATAFLAMAPVYPPSAKIRCTAVLAQRVFWMSLVFLLMTDIAVRVFAT